MDRIATITDFLETTDSRYRVFDLGRRIVNIDRDSFRAFEENRQAYPYPLQQQAWFALLGWEPQQDNDYFIWFLKFPLDETGRLVQANRDAFLDQLMQAALPGKSGEENPLKEAMHDSPFGFKPREQTMAAFHAKALNSLGKPPSRFYEHAIHYLAGESGYEQWAFVGLQGLADVAARIDDARHATLITRAIPHLPVPPLQALCGCLENEVISTKVTEALAQRLHQASSSDDADSITVITACLRGLSYSQAKGLRNALLHELLDSAYASDINLLAAIASRCWEDLKEPATCRAFVEALARNQLGQDAFNQIMADLLFIPGMRTPLLSALRDPQRSEALSRAVGALFGQHS